MWTANYFFYHKFSTFLSPYLKENMGQEITNSVWQWKKVFYHFWFFHDIIWTTWIALLLLLLNNAISISVISLLILCIILIYFVTLFNISFVSNFLKWTQTDFQKIIFKMQKQIISNKWRMYIFIVFLTYSIFFIKYKFFSVLLFCNSLTEIINIDTYKLLTSRKIFSKWL